MQTQEMVGNHNVVLTNLKKICADVQATITALKQYKKAREEHRVVYDHYRTKVEKLEKKKDKKKVEKCAANKVKLEKAKEAFENESVKLENAI
mmetsp:Transcript_35324/g.34354  ORF Transcript_35324/g.34354 Transcript_35324/m.34354 type:complete len:93 (-) Transcript_35324:138-416(-)